MVAAGRPEAELAEELGIGSSLLYGWKQESQRAQFGSEGVSVPGDAGDAADELGALRREVARLKVENDILKKAAIILGTSPQPKLAP